MMRSIALLLFLLCCSCSGERSVEPEKVAGGWRLSEFVSMELEDTGISESAADMFGRKLISEGKALFFFPDGKFTELTDYSTKSGDWSLTEENLLTYNTNQFTVNGVMTKGKNTFMETNIPLPDAGSIIMKWARESEMLESYQQDPFYPANNSWRQKPSVPETANQIRARLLNHLRHYAYILNAADKRDSGVVSFAHSQGIIRVYRGGIGQVNKGQINEDWKACFYDEEDAMRAYNLFGEFLKRGKYKGATTGEWVRDDYLILMSIGDRMEAGEGDVPEREGTEDDGLKS